MNILLLSYTRQKIIFDNIYSTYKSPHGTPPRVWIGLYYSVTSHNSLPSLGVIVQKILFEEKRISIISPLSSNTALAATPSWSANEFTFYKNCKLHGHKFANYPTIECMYCHKRGHILENCPTLLPTLLDIYINPRSLLNLVLHMLLLLPPYLILPHLWVSN